MSARPTRNLDDAIRQLYQAFANVPKPHQIDGCPCCIDRKQVGVLSEKQLRELTPRELSVYASSAFLTVGQVADYRYFLPRILEITATEVSWWPSPQVTARAIREASPKTWTAEQRSALNEYLEAVVDSVIQSGEYFQLDAWICAIAKIGMDVRPFLVRVSQCPAAVLVSFESNANTLPRKKLANPFWELPCPAHDAVVDWFYSAEIADIPFQAYGYRLTPAQ